MKPDYRRHPNSEYRFFLYDPEGYGFTFFRTAEERDAAASDAIFAYLDDEWAKEVEGVFAGEVTHHTIPTNVTMRPKREDFDSEEDFEDALAEFGDSDCDYTCNYELRPLGTTPAQEPMSRDREIWRAALTLANNICVQASNRYNGDDATQEAAAASYCAQRIRDWIAPTDEQFAELLEEAGISKGDDHD